MSKWLRSNGDGTYTPEGIEANIGSMSDLPNPQKTVTENIKYVSAKKKTVSGTTTNSGALLLPNEIKFHVLSCRTTSYIGFAFDRGDGYLTCFNSQMQPLANTSVTIEVKYTEYIEG